MNQANQNYIRSTRLTDILDLQRIARGVNMDITQLDAGSFESDVAQLKVRNVLASLITSNRRLRLQGNVNFLTVSFMSRSQARPSGTASRQIERRPGGQRGETFDLVVPPGVEAYCVSVVGDAEVTLRNLGGPVLAGNSATRPADCVRSERDSGDWRWLAEQFDGFGGDSEIRNGPALQLEQEFLRRLAACMRAGTLHRATRFDPSWEGSMSCGASSSISWTILRYRRRLTISAALPAPADAHSSTLSGITLARPPNVSSRLSG